ncbi:hypothetical protein [Marinifilum caeruleilacunae]|uniref:Uncharacterized protein n=1 Tax=Marinifilum caeruleilacunae TaxID=2499076 RepID=A0ABX1WYC5_9BACT|nr:hypothetical protein [Marinifilum caeruleilacunae]NOU60889.1 hypothetical protein [Marinifilum caeruleilacunae]
MTRLSDQSDEKLVTDIISESFKNNPSVISSLKNDHKINKRIKELAKYAFRTANRRKGVFLSSNDKGVAICYHFGGKKNSLADYWDQIMLLINAIGVRKLPAILQRESYIKKIRPQDGNYLYFWFFGVKESYRGSEAARELQTAIFRDSENKQLPIYLETSLEGNLLMEVEGLEAFTMNEGDMYIVKKGLQHRVSSQAECKILLIENKSTAHTGEVKSDITKDIKDQLQ